MKPEQLLTTRVCNYIREHYPEQIFRVDIGADVPLPAVLAKRAKSLHGKWSTGYPDIFIARVVKKYGGLYLELKATEKVANSTHTRRQAYIHEVLRKSGYKVDFCCGFEDCTEKIKKYLKYTSV